MRADGRSKREGESFVRLPHRLIDAPAFKALSPVARTMLTLVMARYCGNPAHNGDLPFAARDAEAWGIGRTAASEALAELVAFGFLERASEAAMLGRVARRWRCSELPTADGSGREVAPTFAARRLTGDDVARICAQVAANRQVRKPPDSVSLERLKNNARPPPRTQLSGAADTNRPKARPTAVVSGAADANGGSAPTLCPERRTASISTIGTAKHTRPVLHVIDVSESGEAAPEGRRSGRASKPPPDPSVAAKIRQLIAGGMTQREIGAGIGHSRSHVAAVLQGVNRLNADAQAKLERLVGEVTARVTAAGTSDP